MMPLDEIEEEMLQQIPLRRANSRLSRQVFMKPELDGIVIHASEDQVNVGE